MQAVVADDSGAALQSKLVWRLRTVSICIALTALAFLQEPGMVAVDTKTDLALNPAGWVQRALHLWDPSSAFGQLQNQAYGYLWPMGPFFLAGSWLGLPAWVIQRLWWAVLLCVAFTGVVTLCQRMGIGTPASRLLAGVAFALSTRMLTEIGTISIEAWPMALAPWLLVPLIGLAHGGRLRPAVTRSALVVACAGGVNATAVLAVLPLALLWLAMLQPLRLRLMATAAWTAAVACATAWWVLPLLILGRFSPPFLDYIETAEVTTNVTDVVTNLRGASHWLAYLGGPYGQNLPTGWLLATNTALIIASVAVVAVGIAGLARRGLPHRRFLVTGLVVGVALVGFGHLAFADGAFAEQQRAFLDGVGAPLRNVHKFDAVLRLPLVLGLAHLVGVLGRATAIHRHRHGMLRRGPNPARLPAILVTSVAAAGIVGIATPALAGGLSTPGGFKEIPSYWHEAADWLDANLEGDRVLVLPAARSPKYLWGSPTDEITQSLMSGDWAVRNSIPLTPPNTIRLLDAVESLVSTGYGSPGLADLLARSGVRYVLLRSDLDFGRSGTTRPFIVRQSLERSAGLYRAAAFGPTIGGAKMSANQYLDDGLDVPVRVLEVYRIDRPVSRVVAYDAETVTTVVGGPESLLDLAAAGQLTTAPTILAGDRPHDFPAGAVALTDGLRRREVAFGQLHGNASATMTADEKTTLDGPAPDYLPEWGPSANAVVAYRGIRGIRASSSWAQAQAHGNGRPEHQPFAALDRDPETSWQPAPGVNAVGQWIEVSLETPQRVPELRLDFDPSLGGLPTKITVTAGAETESVDVIGTSATVRLPGALTVNTVRVTVDEVARVRGGLGTVGVTEMRIPGLFATRTVVVPVPPATSEPATVVLTAAPSVPSCFFVDDRPRCSPGVFRGSEDGNSIDRVVSLPVSASYTPLLWARSRPGAELNALIDERLAAATPLGIGVSASASTSRVPGPATRPGAVLDGDPTTAWSPHETDADPWLRIRWIAPRTVTGVKLTVDRSVAVSRPGAVTVIGDDGVRGGLVDTDGYVTFDRPMVTDEVTILFLDVLPATSFDPYQNARNFVPIGVGEVTVLPDPPNPRADLDSTLTLPCGSGPSLRAGSVTMKTAISASVHELVQQREVVATPCDGASRFSLPSGEIGVVASASGVVTPTRLALVPGVSPDEPVTSPVQITSWSTVERHLSVAAGPSVRVLAVRENTNPGWVATANGRTLAPIVVDGWQQGWLLPAGEATEVVLKFEPDTAYRALLIIGLALAVLLLVLAFLPERRRGSHALHPNRKGVNATRTVPFVLGGTALVVVGGVTGAVVVAVAGAVAAYQLLPTSTPPAILRQFRRLSGPLELWLPLVLLLLAGWFTLTSDDRHHATGPQIAGILAVACVWFSSVVRHAPRPARPPVLNREFHQVETDRGDHKSAAERQHEDGAGVAGEGLTVQHKVDGLNHQRMPQEEAVRDRS